MPRGTREQLIRYHTQAGNDLERFLMNAKEMHDIYYPIHPKIAKNVQFFAETVVNIQSLWEQFRKQQM